MTLNLCETPVIQLPLLKIKQQDHPMIIIKKQLITELFLLCKKSYLHCDGYSAFFDLIMIRWKQ